VWLGYNGRFVFRQKIAHNERRVSWCIVVLQHPSLVRPQLRPLPAYGDAYIFSNLSDGKTAILENQFTNCADVNVIC
jgi:hypothetical protein